MQRDHFTHTTTLPRIWGKEAQSKSQRYLNQEPIHEDVNFSNHQSNKSQRNNIWFIAFHKLSDLIASKFRCEHSQHTKQYFSQHNFRFYTRMIATVTNLKKLRRAWEKLETRGWTQNTLICRKCWKKTQHNTLIIDAWNQNALEQRQLPHGEKEEMGLAELEMLWRRELRDAMEKRELRDEMPWRRELRDRDGPRERELGSRSRDRERESWVWDRDIWRRESFERESLRCRDRDRELERRLRSREEGCVDGEKGCVCGY